MRHLFYCPLELYPERYTMQLSAPVTGWHESFWIKNEVPYTRVEGVKPELVPIREGKGLVLDAARRVRHCFIQINTLIAHAEAGNLTSADVIYFDDFWHPGIEALRYAFDQYGIQPKMYSFCHAQSVDTYDFTYQMRNWMRDYERGNARLMSGIFVASSMLKALMLAPVDSTYPITFLDSKIYVTGHVFDSEEVKNRMGTDSKLRENKVVFSSRLDAEKRPHFLMDVIEKVLERNVVSNPYFVVCSSSPTLRSNDQSAIERLMALNRLTEGIEIKLGLTKEQYYGELKTAKVQLNTSLQDWVSYVLLEGSVAGCIPVYPNSRSFPEALDEKFLYEVDSVASCVEYIEKWLKCDTLWTKEAIRSREWIHATHDKTRERMLAIMRGQSYVGPYAKSI